MLPRPVVSVVFCRAFSVFSVQCSQDACDLLCVNYVVKAIPIHNVTTDFILIQIGNLH
jgi:hypothetical protein